MLHLVHSCSCLAPPSWHPVCATLNSPSNAWYRFGRCVDAASGGHSLSFVGRIARGPAASPGGWQCGFHPLHCLDEIQQGDLQILGAALSVITENDGIAAGTACAAIRRDGTSSNCGQEIRSQPHAFPCERAQLLGEPTQHEHCRPEWGVSAVRFERLR